MTRRAQSWAPRGIVAETLIGSGSTAQVWLGRIRQTGESVALKRIRIPDAERRARARDEAALLAALDHPGIVRLRTCATSGDSLVLVLDLAARGSLRDLLRARGRLSVGEAVTALTPIAAALAHLHSRDVVHGDVSAANVLFDGAGVALLSDVGVARLAGDPRTAAVTPAYIDPHVAAGGVPGPASDVFMAGALAFHVLTGGPLWPSGVSPMVTLAAAVGGVPATTAEVLRRLAPTLADVVMRALRDDPADRCSAIELALDLRHAADPVPVEFCAGTSVDGDDDGPDGVGTVPGAAALARGVLPAQPLRRSAAPQTETAARADAVPPVGPGRSRLVLPAEFGRRRGRGAPTSASRHRARHAKELPAVPERRGPVRTAVLAAAALTVVAAGVAVLRPSNASTAIGRPHASPSTPPRSSERQPQQGSTSAAASASWWGGQLVQLDRLRARAYAERRPELLDQVYASDGLRDVDQRTLLAATPAGCVLTGAVTTYRVVSVQTADDRAQLTVTARLPPTVLTCADGRRSAVAGTAETRLRVELTRTAAGTRITGQQLA